MNNIIEKEPNTAGTVTSSNKKSIYEYDNTEPIICQALKFAKLATEQGADITYESGVFVITPIGK